MNLKAYNIFAQHFRYLHSNYLFKKLLGNGCRVDELTKMAINFKIRNRYFLDNIVSQLVHKRFTEYALRVQ